MCFSKDSDQLIVAFRSTVRFYMARSGCLLRVAGELFKKITVVMHVRDKMLTADSDGIIRLWDDGFIEEACHQQFTAAVVRCCVALSEDLLAVGLAGGQILILSLPTLETVKMFGSASLKGGQFRCLQFSSTATRLLADEVIYNSSKPNVHIYDVHTGSLLFDLLSYGAVCYSFDGAYIYGSSLAKGLRCWDSENGIENEIPFEAIENKIYQLLSVFCADGVILM
jgi:WD40 repeat protein